MKKVAMKNLKKPKVAENSKSCQNSKQLPKISKVAEKLLSNLWLSLDGKAQLILNIHTQSPAHLEHANQPTLRSVQFLKLVIH